MKKTLIIVLIGLLFTCFAFHKISYVYATYDVLSKEMALDDIVFDTSAFRDKTYYRTYLSWLEDYQMISLSEKEISVADFIMSNPLTQFVSTVEKGMVASLEEGESLTVEISVLETGLYEIGIDFYMPMVFYTVPTLNILINGSSPYNEASSIELNVAWKIEPLEEEYRYNRYGNELLPKSVSIQEWSTYYFDDYNGYTLGNYQFLLEAGVNEITFTAQNLPIYISNVYVKGHLPSQSYQEYLANYSGLLDQSDSQLIVIQGESFVKKNDLEIKSSYYKESQMTPYSYKNTVLNQLDGNSMSRGGSKVTYEFEVVNPGFYNLALKLQHQTNQGVVSGKTFYLDGSIVFSDLEGTTFESTKKWENVTLEDEFGSAYLFYLSVGIHSLTIESTVWPFMEYINELNTIMDEINSISLQVQTITGGNQDDAIDWNILKYIPSLQSILNNHANRLEEIYDEINALDQSLTSAPEISTLNVAAKQLRRIAITPNKIGSKLAEFSEGSGSAYQLIGNAISSMLSQPLSIDQIYFYNNVTLPKPNGSFFTKLWHGIKSFFYSFFDTRYNNFDVDEETLEVWVGQSSLYLDIIQSMIDQDFTKETNIKVKCSILSDASKIILSNATGDNPDVVLSLDTWIPYAYALRGMLKDLTEYDDFDTVSRNQVANNYTTLIFENGVYGIPETQSIYLLYYRKDILNYLNLDVPDTWEDVLNMLPILQSHQMNFFHPLGGESAFKGYGFTTPLIYQFGGEIYSSDGISTTLKDPTTVKAIKFMTDLFTIYDLPLQVSSFFEHFRSGDIPIGISTIDLYLQLKYAAPELSGQWGVSVIPGMDADEDGEVERYATAYGKASILFENSNLQDEGWELIKWWNDTITQIEFMQNIKTSLGEKFLIISANMDALQASVWDEDIKKQMISQAKWARTPAITPGSYIVERELSNIWNKIVIDLMNESVAINESIPRITRELNRKFEEFGYKSSTNPIGKDYIVPMNSNISLWIKGDDDVE